ncbi:MAG: aldo/keto reductase [Dehalococcoidales bacterium]|jgi:aryl-alcohol dehydrogenase-like predicted oxidoreductase|nr:aldo/keto reductase [Dehalococcoidales bacterium]|tara:strand:+ start:1417 stop:2382 length:966 start_codon:yes stop_codon:yes gene_type:complete
MGRTGLMVSEICLGTMTFGQQVNEADAIKIIKSALEAGVNFIDTADGYVNGKSEEIIGKALKDVRHAAVLATKVGAWQSGPGINDAGSSRQHIIQGVEDSLRRLGTDYIDLYYIHMPDYSTPINETLRALNDLVRQGKVRYLACSNFRAWQLTKALWTSDQLFLARFDCIQSPYNLITRDIEYELLPCCASEGVGVTVYNPLAGGLLTGKHDPAKPPPTDSRFTMERLGKMYSERYWTNTNFEVIARLKETAKKHGRSLTHFALAWIMSNEIVTSVISGVSSLKQLEDNLDATETKLSEEELSVCDEVWHQLRPSRFLYGR